MDRQKLPIVAQCIFTYSEGFPVDTGCPRAIFGRALSRVRNCGFRLLQLETKHPGQMRKLDIDESVDIR